MSDHDIACPMAAGIEEPDNPGLICECHTARRARADEREQAAIRAEQAATYHEFRTTDGTVYDTLVSLNDVCIRITGGDDA